MLLAAFSFPASPDFSSLLLLWLLLLLLLLPDLSFGFLPPAIAIVVALRLGRGEDTPRLYGVGS